MCSTIIFGDGEHKFLAENYDYVLDHGLVSTHQKGTKKSNGQLNERKAVYWSVKFGSITFSQLSLELPVSGMNEAGLAIALMWHDGGDCGDSEKYRRLNSLQWIQYQLDNFATIDEVIECLQTIRPEPGPVPLHYNLLDARGNSLAVEFEGGELVLHKNVEFPILTNTGYRASIEAVNRSDDRRLTENSLGRFNRLYKQLSSLEVDLTVQTGFNLLDSVNQVSSNTGSFPWSSYDNETTTVWSIVFDPVNQVIHLKTNVNEAVREFRLSDFSFDAAADYLTMDIHNITTAPIVKNFRAYTKEDNYNILRLAAPAVNLPDQVIGELADTVDFLYRNRRMN